MRQRLDAPWRCDRSQSGNRASMFSRSFSAIALGVCSFAGVAVGQSEGESHSYAAATLEMIVDRALPSPPTPSGLVRNPQPTFGVQASDLTRALFEDATYRIGE